MNHQRVEIMDVCKPAPTICDDLVLRA